MAEDSSDPAATVVDLVASTDVESLIADLTAGPNGEVQGGYDHLTVAQAVQAALIAERRASPAQSWDNAATTTKRWAGGLAAVLVTCGGSLYAWTNEVVTQGKLDATVAPIEQKLETQGAKLKEVSVGVDDLLDRSDRRREIDKAKLLVDKLSEGYDQRLREWEALSPSRRRAVRKPVKSPALLMAESELESLLSK
jgi:hypothetical protein